MKIDTNGDCGVYSLKPIKLPLKYAFMSACSQLKLMPSRRWLWLLGLLQCECVFCVSASVDVGSGRYKDDGSSEEGVVCKECVQGSEGLSD